MANLITLSRLLLFFVLLASAYYSPAVWQLANAPLLILIIFMDAIDGWVARRRRETSVFGSIFDIAVDRVVENVLWIVLANLGLVPVWATIVFVIRGTIVDAIRYAAIASGESAFGMMKTPFGRFLVAGRFMRGFYGTLKAVTFGWVLFLQPLPTLAPAFWGEWSGALDAVTMTLVVASVMVCVLRGLPVVLEWVAGPNGIRKLQAQEVG
jgi:CDP-diacylglycerol---glycerol-3-phosphate 3-phosphatidyltransferase